MVKRGCGTHCLERVTCQSRHRCHHISTSVSKGGPSLLGQHKRAERTGMHTGGRDKKAVGGGSRKVTARCALRARGFTRGSFAQDGESVLRDVEGSINRRLRT